MKTIQKIKKLLSEKKLPKQLKLLRQQKLLKSRKSIIIEIAIFTVQMTTIWMVSESVIYSYQQSLPILHMYQSLPILQFLILLKLHKNRVPEQGISYRSRIVDFLLRKFYIFTNLAWKSVHALKMCSKWNLHYNASYPFSLLVLSESKIFWKGLHNLTSVSCILLVYPQWRAYLQFTHMYFCWQIYHIKNLC